MPAVRKRLLTSELGTAEIEISNIIIPTKSKEISESANYEQKPVQHVFLGLQSLRGVSVGRSAKHLRLQAPGINKGKGQRSRSPSLLEQGAQARRGPGVSSFPPGPKLNTWLVLCKPEGSLAVV